MRNFEWIALACLVTACSGTDPASKWDFEEPAATNNSTTQSNNGTTRSNNATTQTIGTTTSTNNATTSNNTTTSTTTQTTAGCLSRAPEHHRPDGVTCSRDRAPGITPPDDALDFASCTSDDECTDGDEGRCIGNGHDGYYCTYNECASDDECGGGVCECSGGFRGDHNICVPGNCQTDSDCATGFCSPSWGSCGAYSGNEAYYCRTCEDECVTDADCGNEAGDPWGSYCAFDPGVGHWRCSDSHCAG